MTEQLKESRQSVGATRLLRGGSLFSALVFGVVTAFLAIFVTSVWQNARFQRGITEKARLESTRAVGQVLARTVEALLTANELSTLRRIVTEVATECGFESCRVVLPDGGVLAASDPGKIDTLVPSESWAIIPGTYKEDLSGDTVTFSFPLVARGKGSAALDLVARTSGMSQRATLELQTTQMAIACLSLALMLLVYHHARFRLRALDAVQKVVLAAEDHPSDFSSLELDPKLGREAVAWNKLLGEKQLNEVHAAVEQVKESIHKSTQTSAELSAACDALPQGLMLINSEMKAAYANGAASVLLQKNRGEMIGVDVSELIADGNVLDAIRRASGASTCLRVVAQTEQKESAVKAILRFTLRPLRQNDGSAILVVIEDVSQYQVAEEARASFLARAAHELRTPLTNIELHAESALENCQCDPSSTAQSLAVVNEESHRLERVVNEILSISEMEAGAFSPKKDDLNLEELMRQLKTDYASLAEEKKISLVFELPPKLPVLHADRDKFALALHNLIGNALKYTEVGGHVAVTATVAQDRLTIDVTDTGIGIRAEDMSKVFDKFYRAEDQRVVDIKGSGLGLAIARDVIRLHGGDITVESELNRGSTFTVMLPIAAEDL